MSQNLILPTATAIGDILTGAAFAPLPDLGWIIVTGPDRVRWLNGMVTNNIAALEPGQGCYNFFLNAQGRIQGDCTAFLLQDSILLQSASERIPALVAMLEHYIIMDDVELTIPESDHLQGIAICGPNAADLMPVRFLNLRESATSYGLVQGNFLGEPMTVVSADNSLVPRFELWASRPTMTSLSRLMGEQSELIPATAADLEHLRILSGTPLYGVDIRNSDAAKDLPQETSQTRALNFSKGCYLGQEIVERIRSRGQVHGTFIGFVLTGELPPVGTQLHNPAAPNRPAGELTSVGSIPLPSGTQQLALGYIRRDALEAKLTLTYPGGTAQASALPFPIPESRP